MALPWAGDTTFVGGADGVRPDEIDEMIVKDGKVRAFLWAIASRREGLARRITDTR